MTSGVDSQQMREKEWPSPPVKLLMGWPVPAFEVPPTRFSLHVQRYSRWQWYSGKANGASRA